MTFHENVFPFALSESNSSFSTVLRALHIDPHMLKSNDNIFNKVSVMDDDVPFNVTYNNMPEQSLAPDPPTDNQIPNTITQPPVQSLNLRRSSRSHKIPTYLKEYTYTLYSLQHQSSTPSSHIVLSLSCLSLTSSNQNDQPLVKGILHDNEPCSYEEAVHDSAWQATMTSEFEALYANNTWDIVKLPIGKKSIGCRWVYKINIRLMVQ